ncbi:MAG TPA: chemotaxis-specific protein-glutamate methyltransferase CheB [Treponemataceae bacterium]|nr:chemotaxis-specific protein-glutamate methyltransferase CheB [Treponemataceae bacterium]HOQ92854.1 chemotaxis-specific protein-glutamate methyltransferase CheB [Treponemataceae bacterium]HPM05883.1 chemotaxis-specific protein-glutamate methyltransferase CheB [Treponemataceae bacterium]
MTRVLLVDDSAIIRNMLSKSLQKNSLISVVGEAGNGLKAVELAKQLKPDVIIMDVSMPLIDGIEATKRIMEKTPCAIVIFTSEDSFDLAYKALEFGAVEIIQKPDLSILTSSFYREFFDKIHAIAEANTGFYNRPLIQTQEKCFDSSIQGEARSIGCEKLVYEIVGIASSTGGPLAIQKLLQELGPDFPLPILIVQHIETNFDTHFVSWLSQTSPLPVHLAQHNQKIEKGHVYVAPANYHMVVVGSDFNKDFFISLNKEAEKHFLRPAADPLFFSLAKLFANRCISIVLTGMGSDGAEGSLQLKEVGAYTIAESKESCVVFGMPKAAIDKGAIKEILPLSAIPKTLLALVNELTTAQIDSVLQLIYAHCGMSINGSHVEYLKRYLKKRLALRAFSFNLLYADLLKKKEEFELLINSITINETYFFREEKHFFYLRDIFLPQKKHTSLSIWSAACSSGEEAYSLSILCKSLGIDAEVYASDINTFSLEALQKGNYSPSSLREDGSAFHTLLEPYLTYGQKNFSLSKEILVTVQSFPFNLFRFDGCKDCLSDKKFDVIFLRNVFIYFSDETKQACLRFMEGKLKPEGLLFVSTNEIASIQIAKESSLKKYKESNVFFFRKEGGITCS